VLPTQPHFHPFLSFSQRRLAAAEGRALASAAALAAQPGALAEAAATGRAAAAAAARDTLDALERRLEAARARAADVQRLTAATRTEKAAGAVATGAETEATDGSGGAREEELRDVAALAGQVGPLASGSHERACSR